MAFLIGLDLSVVFTVVLRVVLTGLVVVFNVAGLDMGFVVALSVVFKAVVVFGDGFNDVVLMAGFKEDELVFKAGFVDDFCEDDLDGSGGFELDWVGFIEVFKEVFCEDDFGGFELDWVDFNGGMEELLARLDVVLALDVFGV
jgi:hypothetical protein